MFPTFYKNKKKTVLPPTPPPPIEEGPCGGLLLVLGMNLQGPERDDVIPPSAPVFDSPVASVSTLDLSWSESIDNVELESYALQTSLNGSDWTTLYVGLSRFVRHSGLPESTTHHYRVRAQDVNGNVSAWTTIVTSTTSGFSYPRLHGHLLGGAWYSTDSVTPERFELISRFNTTILGIGRRWSNGGYNISNVAGAIKAYNPNIKIMAAFSLVQAESTTQASGQHRYIKYKLENEIGPNGIGDWWLYTTDGQHINGWRGTPDLWRINCAPTVTPDEFGHTFPEWMAHYLWDATGSGTVDYITVGYGFSQGAWDGVYEDDQYLTYSHPNMAISTGDWDRDGTAENKNDADLKAWLAAAHTGCRDECKAIQPNKWFFGNMVNLFNEPSVPADFRPNDGGFFEEMCRYEATQGWTGTPDSMMERFREGVSLMNADGPKLGILHNAINIIRGYYDGTNPSRPTLNYSNARWNRYFMCSALMEDGLYAVSDSAQGGYSNLLWFDEFWGGSLQQLGYLGYAIDPAQTSASQNGVYIREFQNGLVVVNPGGNGTQTVNVGSGWKRMTGTQDPIHNNGQVVQSFSLEDRDGIILLRV